jgi:hypothetical protein
MTTAAATKIKTRISYDRDKKSRIATEYEITRELRSKICSFFAKKQGSVKLDLVGLVRSSLFSQI